MTSSIRLCRNACELLVRFPSDGSQICKLYAKSPCSGAACHTVYTSTVRNQPFSLSRGICHGTGVNLICRYEEPYMSSVFIRCAVLVFSNAIHIGVSSVYTLGKPS